MSPKLLVLSVLPFLAACTHSNVTPLLQAEPIMCTRGLSPHDGKQYYPVIAEKFRERGIELYLVKDIPPSQCRHEVRMSLQTKGELSPSLHLFEIIVYQETPPPPQGQSGYLGSVHYADNSPMNFASVETTLSQQLDVFLAKAVVRKPANLQPPDENTNKSTSFAEQVRILQAWEGNYVYKARKCYELARTAGRTLKEAQGYGCIDDEPTAIEFPDVEWWVTFGRSGGF